MIQKASNRPHPPSIDRLAAMFKALGDPTRLRIFEILRDCAPDVAIDESGDCRPAGSLSVGEVCCRIDQAGSTISHHLKELRHAGLILTAKRGRWIYCSVHPEALDTLRVFLNGGETRCGEPAPSAPLRGCCEE